jgi:hypothetical protein
MVMLCAPLIAPNVQVLAEVALRHRLPAITLFPDFARAGGLLAQLVWLAGVLADAASSSLHDPKRSLGSIHWTVNWS